MTMMRYEAFGSIDNTDKTIFQMVINNGNLLITMRATTICLILNCSIGGSTYNTLLVN